MSLVKIDELCLSLGEHPLLDKVHLTIHNKERIALVGRNGAGKSTLLRIIAGLEKSDSGKIESRHCKISYLTQDLPPDEHKTAFDFVSEGLSDISHLLQTYHHLTHQTPENLQDQKWLTQLSDIQKQIENKQGWDIQHRIEKILSELSIPEDARIQSLSGGWRRRLSLAKTLINEPDLLLLDEPTNHLDIDAICWLENYLLTYPKSIMFITHDRALIKNLANKIFELDRGHVHQYNCDYESFLDRKNKRLEEEYQQTRKLDQKLSEEEAWLRQGVKARRKRNQGRLQKLLQLRETRKNIILEQAKPNFKANQSERTNKLVLEAENISFAYSNQKPIINDFSFIMQRGDKVAIIGPNGVGKTTLIKLLLDKLKPTEGKLYHSPKIQVAYFDQTRETLSPELSAIDNVVEGDDFIQTNQKRQHVISYLSDFLFPPEKARGLAKTLSGGEQNRLLLAKLFAKPANILVLDEPTNDLDLESLELLENLLLDYEGSVLIISHDRDFINNIATHYIAFEASAKITLGVGGYSDWQKRAEPQEKEKTKAKSQTPKKQPPPTTDKVSNKLSYNQQRELNLLPGKIEKLEQEIQDIQLRIQSPEFYQQPQELVRDTNKQLQSLQDQLDELYTRWEELE